MNNAVQLNLFSNIEEIYYFLVSCSIIFLLANLLNNYLQVMVKNDNNMGSIFEITSIFETSIYLVGELFYSIVGISIIYIANELNFAFVITLFYFLGFIMFFLCMTIFLYTLNSVNKWNKICLINSKYSPVIFKLLGEKKDIYVKRILILRIIEPILLGMITYSIYQVESLNCALFYLAFICLISNMYMSHLATLSDIFFRKYSRFFLKNGLSIKVLVLLEDETSFTVIHIREIMKGNIKLRIFKNDIDIISVYKNS